MLRLGCKLALSIILVTALLTLSARIFGTAQSAHPALQAFSTGCEDQPQPCWFGIVPGKTTEPEINRLLAFAGEPDFGRTILSRDDFTLGFDLPPPWPYCRAVFDFSNDVVVLGKITLCREPDIRVGDLTLLLQDEDWIISLPPNELIHDHLAANVEGWPDPFSRVSYLSLLKADAPFQHYPWHGFISQHTYCQHEPDYPRC